MNIEADAARALGWVEDRLHHQTSAAQAAAAPAKGTTMSLLDTIKNGIAEAETKLEGIAEEDLALIKRVQGNPETAVILRDLDALAVMTGIPQGFITGTANALKVLISAYTPPAA